MSFAPASRAALYRDAIVDDSHWTTEGDFQESLTLAQFLPGPNLVNLSVYLGLRMLSFWSVVLGLLCLALPGALLAILVVEAVPLQNPHIEQVFRGFSFGSVALMFVFLWRLRRGVMPTFGISHSKVAARFLVLLSAAAASYSGIPLQAILLAGVPLCLLVEFGIV